MEKVSVSSKCFLKTISELRVLQEKEMERHTKYIAKLEKIKKQIASFKNASHTASGVAAIEDLLNEATKYFSKIELASQKIADLSDLVHEIIELNVADCKICVHARKRMDSIGELYPDVKEILISPDATGTVDVEIPLTDLLTVRRLQELFDISPSDINVVK